MKKFRLCNEEFIVDDNLEKYNEYRLVFENMAQVVVGEFKKVYKENIKTLDEVINKIPQFAKANIVNALTNGVIPILVHEGIMNVDEDLFIDKYYYNYFNFDEYFDPILTKYAEITEAKQSLQQYRDMQKASRSRWQGGGFGVKGAVKGAMTAGALNLGTDFLRSFGDSSRASKDAHQIEDLKRKVFNAPETYNNILNGLYNCTFGTFFGLIDELEENELMDVPEIDYKQAQIIFNNTMKYTKDYEKIINSVCDCIKLYPYEFQFYKILIEAEDEDEDILDIAKYFGFKDQVKQIRHERNIKQQRLSIYFTEEERLNSKYDLEKECETLKRKDDKVSVDDIKANGSILAKFYRNGQEGYDKDIERAIYWYNRSGELGNINAQISLAMCYYKGECVVQDYKKAVPMLEDICAKKKEPELEYKLGECYFEGKGVEVDYKKAFDHFCRGQGISTGAGYYSLAVMYEEGKGVEKNLEKAIEYYLKGKENGLFEYPKKCEEALIRLRNDSKEVEEKVNAKINENIEDKAKEIQEIRQNGRKKAISKDLLPAIVWVVGAVFFGKYIPWKLVRYVIYGLAIITAIYFIYELITGDTYED